MVKDSKKKRPPYPTGLPRPKIGRPFGEDEPRDHRVMMRVHHHLIRLIDAQAAERNESRSRFIEKLLVAFIKADPRNPKVDAAGRIDPDSPAPLSATKPDQAARFGAQWARYVQINQLLFNHTPPDEWMVGDAGLGVWNDHKKPDEPGPE